MYCNLILNIISKSVCDLFTYEIPDDLENKVKVGDRVIVNFGNSNRLVDALIYSIQNETNLKNVKRILDVLPHRYSLSETQVFLINAMRNRYGATYNYAFASVLSGVQHVDIFERFIVNDEKYSQIIECGQEFSKKELLNILGKKIFKELSESGKIVRSFKYEARINSKFEEIAHCNFTKWNLKNFGVRKNAIKQIRILEHIYDTKTQKLNDLLKATSSNRSDIRHLVEKKLIVVKKELLDIDSTKYELKANNIMHFNLSSEQRIIVDEYESCKRNSDVFRGLIQGVTGSGKTRLYMELSKKMIESGKQVLILLPEISLTPQLIGVFKENISDKISVIHNKINHSEKSVYFEKIKTSDAEIIIGARSAIFAPFSNLGLIVIDEVHENTYVNESTPRYDVRELAFDLSMGKGIDLIYGSATPSLQLLNLTDKYIKKYVMKKRIGNSQLPDIKIVDMRNEFSPEGEILVSNKLIAFMEECFQKKEQVILFYNRRGYANFLLCPHCGYVEKCLNCDISLKVHKRGESLNCHYCGYAKKMPNSCLKCGQIYCSQDSLGAGIDKYLEYFMSKFPDKKFAKVDSESVNTQAKLIGELDEFRNGNTDCLIGTQILAKGLDFPNVTLVGILDADQLINMPDYMANERAFQLIAQVSGRAGRHGKAGKVIVQTFNPEDELFQFLIKNNFEDFIKSESEMRKLLFYPPFSKLYRIGISSESDEVAKNDIVKVYKALNLIFSKLELNTTLYKPSPFYYTKLRNRYIYNIIMKGKKEEYSKVVNVLYQVISTDKYHLIDKKSHVFLDFNPIFL